MTSVEVEAMLNAVNIMDSQSEVISDLTEKLAKARATIKKQNDALDAVRGVLCELKAEREDGLPLSTVHTSTVIILLKDALSKATTNESEVTNEKTKPTEMEPT